MKDWRGNEFDVGDHVVYGQPYGNHGVTMVEGEVIEITEVKSGWSSGAPVVVVQPFAESRSKWRPHGQPRNARLLIIENITLVEKRRDNDR